MARGIRRTIEIVTQMKDRLSGKTRKVNKRINEYNNGVKKATTRTQQWNKGQQTTDRVTRKTTRGMRRFRYEWLSVMFLGMAVNRVFGRYVKQTLEMIGITEMLTEALKLSIFEAISPFLDNILSLVGAFFDLSPAMQSAIGWIFLFLAVISGALMWVGMLNLGIDGLMAVNWGSIVSGLGTLVGYIKAAVAWFVGLPASIIALIVAIVAIIIGMYVAWRENFMNMKTIVDTFIQGVKDIFGSIWLFIKGIWQTITGLITLDWEKMFKGMKNTVNSFVIMARGVFQVLVSALAGIFVGFIRVIKWLLDLLFDDWKSTWNKMYYWVVDIIKSIGDWIGWLIDEIQGAINSMLTLVGLKEEREETAVEGVRQMGGNINTTGLYRLHRGETIIPANKTGGRGVNLTVNYNVEVSDRAEFQRMLEENNDELVRDVRRMIKT